MRKEIKRLKAELRRDDLCKSLKSEVRKEIKRLEENLAFLKRMNPFPESLKSEVRR